MLVTQFRHESVKFPSLRDAFGGHETPGDSSPLDTAVREANSELKLSLYGLPLAWSIGQIRRLGDEYSFKVDHSIPDKGGINREFSTVYLLRTPIQGCDLQYQEECEDGFVVQTPESQTQDCKLDELIRLNCSYPEIFADGLGRVLSRLEHDEALKAEIGHWLDW